MKKLILTLLLTQLMACSDPEVSIENPNYESSELGSKTVALVDRAKITRAQLDHALAFYSSNPMVNAAEGRIKVLNDMIEEQVLYNKALESGFDKSPEYLNNQRKLLAFEYRKFLKKKVALNLKVSDVDLQIYYEQNKGKYTKPEMKRLAIYLQRSDMPEKASLTLKQVKEATQYLKPEEGFGKYALDSHHINTANRAGKLPWISKGSQLAGVPEAVITAADNLVPGAISSPIKTDSGTFLVRLMTKKEKQVTPLSQIKASLRQQLVTQRKQQSLAGFIKKAKNDSKIEIIETNMGKPGALNTANESFGPPGFPVK